MKKQYLGLGKTKFNSSVCLIDEDTVELLLTERLNRKKNSGLWPEAGLNEISPRLNRSTVVMAENRDVHRPHVIEDTQNKLFPFYEYLKKKDLDFFTSKENSRLEFVPHHFCHAYAALACSPFEKSVIVVMDGAGSEVAAGEYEECSVFLQDGVSLRLVHQQTVKFEISTEEKGHDWGNRIGASYEKVSEFIFNSPHNSGKVMGLASFGNSLNYPSHVEFQKKLDWSKAFKAKTKKEWESVDHTYFKDIAASVQLKLEEDYEKVIKLILEKYPEYRNLILTGGCALNCTNNAKIYYSNRFEKIFVPAFPGDECIGFGLAHYLKFKEDPSIWKPVSFENQSAYFGAVKSDPLDRNILDAFNDEDFEIKHCEDVIDTTAKLLSDGHVVAWFQGRSESGPRALGNRSILSRPDVDGLKDHLNQNVKFRESFRPYGCSVIHDKAHLYFDVEDGFDNPYMSYAIKVRPEFQMTLKEVSHIDKTSRMQTVRTGQNLKFYNLIKSFGDKTGLYCLLNTSLNVMDEPILETVFDAKRFMKNSPIEYLAIGNFLIKRRS